MFSVSGRMSTKRGVAPRSTNAFTDDTNVNGGQITSSPGPTPASITAISRAWVHDVVSSTRDAPVSASSASRQRAVNAPSPDRCPEAIASAM